MESEILFSIANILVRYESIILSCTPCTVNDIATCLAEKKMMPSIEYATKSILMLAERYQNIVVVEREVTLGYYMIFYYTDALRALLGMQIHKDAENRFDSHFDQPPTYLDKLKQQITSFANDYTALEKISVQAFKEQSGKIPVTHVCTSYSQKACMRFKNACEKYIHLERVVTANGEPSDCSYLDTCFKGKQCKYVHYRVRYPLEIPDITIVQHYMPKQFINTNILQLDFDILGSDYKALIIDPPWDIHTKPGAQGGCSDRDVLNLSVDKLQREGIVFLWVTGRVLDLGRQCLSKWGYEHTEELIWLKTNQLGKTICTGRTGHWLNHTKEHVLVGVKGNSISRLRRELDSDVLVSTALGKSQKPEELYGIIDRIVGNNSKKLELFGRKTNIRPGWLTIGNELGSTSVQDPELRRRLIDVHILR